MQKSSTQINKARALNYKNSAIAITCGSEGGIGLELLAKAWRNCAMRVSAPKFFLVGCHNDIEKLGIPCEKINDPQEVTSIFNRALPIIECENAIESIDGAIELCRKKSATAMVTLPVEKEIFLQNKKISANSVNGHTEYIAKKLDAKSFAMLLVAKNIRALPLTRHVSMRKALDEITIPRILETARLLNNALVKDFGIKKPRLALTALNPHAGEGGMCGDEENRILIPAIKNLRKDGININGPHPADSIFLAKSRKNFDCAITLYHDQALMPIKLLAFNYAVNVTLGLPIVRTSPDHGTARSLVGKGSAHEGSLIASIFLAQTIANLREKNCAT